MRALIIAMASLVALCADGTDTADCQKVRQQYRSELFLSPIRGLAEAEVALVSLPLAQADVSLTVKRLAKVRIACLLKGRPDHGSRLVVRLLPTGRECIDQQMLETTIEAGLGGRFVFLLRRGESPSSSSSSDGSWDLLDGGLFSAGEFFQRTRNVCNLTSAYGLGGGGSSCHRNGTRTASCMPLETAIQVISAKESAPYFGGGGGVGGDGGDVAQKAAQSREESQMLSDRPCSGVGSVTVDTKAAAAIVASLLWSLAVALSHLPC